uniref:Uncharacterized protein n=1 Tax=Arundo donax TaxID=35708 RepID=A0A0A9AUH4_ARUDO
MPKIHLQDVLLRLTVKTILGCHLRIHVPIDGIRICGT